METLPAGGGVPEIEAEESRMPSPDDSRLGSPSSLYRALPDRRNPLGWAVPTAFFIVMDVERVEGIVREVFCELVF